MGHPRIRVRMLGNQHNKQCTRLHQSRQKREGAGESAISVWFSCHSWRRPPSPPRDQQYSFSYNDIRITSSFHAPVFIETESKKCLTAKRLHDALVEHGVGNLHEPGDVRANDEITRVAVLVGGFPCVFENRRHNVAQPRINFFARPWQAHRVLAHLDR
jgi:hypothetical protein